MDFSSSLITALGVSEKVAATFARADIKNLRDLLFHLPIRYENRTKITPIPFLRDGQMAQIFAKVLFSDIIQRKKILLNVTVQDATGETCRLTFFNASIRLKDQFSIGKWGLFFGKAQITYGFQLTHPEVMWLNKNEVPDLPSTLSPIYQTVRGLPQQYWREIIYKALSQPSMKKNDPLTEMGFPTFWGALKDLHFPPIDSNLEITFQPKNLNYLRLKIEELCAHHLSIQIARTRQRRKIAPVLSRKSPLIENFLTNLPFSLTPAQARVCTEIQSDLEQEKPMMRLIQGDVGSGKTIVALIACLQAVSAGKQAVFLVPTELLAEQHYNNIKQLTSNLPVEIVLLVGKMRSREKKIAIEKISTGEANIIVGTHAVFQEKIKYADLALMAIDEQHRFGVHHRLQLQNKSNTGNGIHQLVLTATPIPRTLAMSQFGELDTSIIDALPSGRQPIQTSIIHNSKRDQVIERVRVVCAEGRQVYWVCPLIEESETLECENSITIAEQLKKELPQLTIALLHGRISREERQQIMNDFAAGKTQLLVATTVIEVGVDVPNASIMIVENAERFGLVQLHQLRGRIGRGTEKSYCILLYQSPLTTTAKQRLQILSQIADGFQIAEADLQIRGAGEILGVRQTGEMMFYLSELPRDEELLFKTSEWIENLQKNAPDFCLEIIERWRGNDEQYLQV